MARWYSVSVNPVWQARATISMACRVALATSSPLGCTCTVKASLVLDTKKSPKSTPALAYSHSGFWANSFRRLSSILVTRSLVTLLSHHPRLLRSAKGVSSCLKHIQARE